MRADYVLGIEEDNLISVDTLKFIEFAYKNSVANTYYTLSTYPLYLGTLTNISNGWWDRNLVTVDESAPQVNSFVSGFITLPGFHLVASSNGTIFCDTQNISVMPIYSNVNRPETANQHRYFEASYVLTAIS